MFDVITISEPIKKAKLFKKRKCKIEALQTAVRGGAPFRLIKVTPGYKGVDWQAVARCAGCGSQSVISNISLPPASSLKAFSADTLPLLIMLNTAAKSLSKDEAAKKRRLLITDKYAVLPDYIDKIVLGAARIKIVTDFPDKYYSAAVRVMERFGASITVCNQVEKSEKFDASIGLETIVATPLPFTFDKVSSEELIQIIPEEYLRLCPEGIDKFTFICALFECSGVREIGELWLDDIEF